jgi:peroxiredoxin
MFSLHTLIPRQPVPALDVALVGGGRFTLAAASAPSFTMVVFYRGLHCPVCAKYLMELERLHDDFVSRGVVPVAISSDTAERGAAMAEKLKAEKLRFGYDLPLTSARAWGLTISSSRGKTSIGIEEPALFSEPGLFLIKPDGTLYWGSTQTMPFARPHFEAIIGAIDFVTKNDYPARGEFTGAV